MFIEFKLDGISTSLAIRQLRVFANGLVHTIVVYSSRSCPKMPVKIAEDRRALMTYAECSEHQQWTMWPLLLLVRQWSVQIMVPVPSAD